MSDYIKTKEYKFPDGETVTAYFDEYGIAKITIQALDAIFDNFINSADRVEVVRCKDCKHQEKFFHEDKRRKEGGYYIVGCELADGYSHVCFDDDFCSRAERKDITQEMQDR